MKIIVYALYKHKGHCYDPLFYKKDEKPSRLSDEYQEREDTFTLDKLIDLFKTDSVKSVCNTSLPMLNEYYIKDSYGNKVLRKEFICIRNIFNDYNQKIYNEGTVVNTYTSKIKINIWRCVLLIDPSTDDILSKSVTTNLNISFINPEKFIAFLKNFKQINLEDLPDMYEI